MRFITFLTLLILSLDSTHALIRRFDVEEKEYIKKGDEFPSACVLTYFDPKILVNMGTAVLIGKRTFITNEDLYRSLQDGSFFPIVRCEHDVYQVDQASPRPYFSADKKDVKFVLFRVKEKEVKHITPTKLFEGQVMTLWNQRVLFTGYGASGTNTEGVNTALLTPTILFPEMESFVNSLNSGNTSERNKKIAYEELRTYSLLFHRRAAQTIILSPIEKEHLIYLKKIDSSQTVRDILPDDIYDNDDTVTEWMQGVPKYPVDEVLITKNFQTSPGNSVPSLTQFTISASSLPLEGLPTRTDIAYFTENGELIGIKLPYQTTVARSMRETYRYNFPDKEEEINELFELLEEDDGKEEIIMDVTVDETELPCGHMEMSLGNTLPLAGKNGTYTYTFTYKGRSYEFSRPSPGKVNLYDVVTHTYFLGKYTAWIKDTIEELDAIKHDDKKKKVSSQGGRQRLKKKK